MTNKKFFGALLLLLALIGVYRGYFANLENLDEAPPSQEVSREEPAEIPQNSLAGESKKNEEADSVPTPSELEIKEAPPAALIINNKEEAQPAPTWPKGTVEFEIVEGKYAVGFGDVILGIVPEEKRNLKRAYYDPPPSRLWPSAYIAYSIEEDVPNKNLILEAIEYFAKETPVRFVPRTDEAESIVFTKAESICASQLGRVGGHQIILLSSQCGKKEIIHELMHSLGFVHEHSREDRDRYLDVVWQNIKPEYYLQFQRVPDSWIHEYRGAVFDFDPRSLMLYPSTAFAKEPGAITLKSKGLPLEPSETGLSALDKERLYYLYGK